MPERPYFLDLIDLVSERLGGHAVVANDEFFAAKENLLKVAPPVFIEGKYTDRGKWMDGWESRRRRQPGHDWCIVRLAVPGEIHGVDVDTTHFKGNHPEAASIDACLLAPADLARIGAGDDEVDLLAGDAATWAPIVERSPLERHSPNPIPVPSRPVCSHVRLNIHPDGGVARFRVYGLARPDLAPRPAADAEGPIDLVAARAGGLVLAANDRFFSDPRNLILPGRGVDMGDGWETRRRRGPGHDWCVLRLGRRGVIETVEVDTAHFKGNFPDRCSLQVADLAPCPVERECERDWEGMDWQELLPETPLRADDIRRLDVPAERRLTASHVRLCIHPDGGISRLRLWGRPAS